MRISDWSSDVCSSDLHRVVGPRRDRVALAVLRPGVATPRLGGGAAEIGIGDDVDPGPRRQRAVADHGDVFAAIVGEAAVAAGELQRGLVHKASRPCCGHAIAAVTLLAWPASTVLVRSEDHTSDLQPLTPTS